MKEFTVMFALLVGICTQLYFLSKENRKGVTISTFCNGVLILFAFLFIAL